MIDRLSVIAVVVGSMLLPVNFDGKAVNVDGCLTNATSSGSQNMLLHAASQSTSQCLEVGRVVCKDRNQARLRGLTGQSFVDDLIAGSIPDSRSKGRVVSQSINIVLSGTSDGHGKDTFADQFIDRIANTVSPSWIMDVLSD